MNVILRPQMDNIYIAVFFVWRAMNEAKLKSYFSELCAVPLEGDATVKYELWCVIQHEIEKARELQDHVYIN